MLVIFRFVVEKKCVVHKWNQKDTQLNYNIRLTMGSKGIFITSERKKLKMNWSTQQKPEICEKEISFLINPILNYCLGRKNERWKEVLWFFIIFGAFIVIVPLTGFRSFALEFLIQLKVCWSRDCLRLEWLTLQWSLKRI